MNFLHPLSQILCHASDPSYNLFHHETTRRKQWFCILRACKVFWTLSVSMNSEYIRWWVISFPYVVSCEMDFSNQFGLHKSCAAANWDRSEKFLWWRLQNQNSAAQSVGNHPEINLQTAALFSPANGSIVVLPPLLELDGLCDHWGQRRVRPSFILHSSDAIRSMFESLLSWNEGMELCRFVDDRSAHIDLYFLWKANPWPGNCVDNFRHVHYRRFGAKAHAQSV